MKTVQKPIKKKKKLLEASSNWLEAYRSFIKSIGSFRKKEIESRRTFNEPVRSKKENKMGRAQVEEGCAWFTVCTVTGA